ncbi:MAG: carbohydrate binding family 9 domain-containing protein [Bacteroidetes bacterium]|nr:carbohydrate binding family 9 domain-containing protein [Bacteroidota bacterium]
MKNLIRVALTAICSVVVTSSIIAEVPATRTYSIQKLQTVPDIDGDWNDEVWSGIEATGEFLQSEPVEGAPPSFKTEVKMFYTDNAFFLAAYCYDPEPEKILKQLGTRDDDLNADNFRIALDPYDAQQDFTSFWLTASGVQGDFKNSDRNFNAVWESAVDIKEDGWVVEMKIPYSAIRFPKEANQQWSLQIYRHIRRLQEDVEWSPTKQENVNFMDYFGKVTDIKDIDPPLRLSLTPYLNLQLKTEPNENGNREFDWLISGGADLKYGINESFTIDMTLLPDFSQVQSDDIINNLSAFETIFDEQRTFFQEGVDLFSRGQLFYSRRIGAGVKSPNAASNSLEDGEEIVNDPEKSRLWNAFKISGRTKKDIGIGVFNAIEGRSFAEIKKAEGGTYEVQNDPLSNYNIFVLEKNFKNNRSIYGINTNVARSDGYRNGNVTGGGFSANFGDNKYNVRGSASYSVVNEKIDSTKRKTGYQYVFDFDKVSGQWRYGWRTEGISKDYDRNDMSFNFQTNYLQHGWSTNYNIYEPMKHVNYLNTLLFLNFRQHMPTGELSAAFLNLNASTTFSKSYLNIGGGLYADVYGEKDYYEARTEGQVFRRPKFINFYTNINTDDRKKLNAHFDAHASLSGERGGSFTFGGGVSPEWQANDQLTFGYSFNSEYSINDIGYVDHTDEDKPVVGRRDILELVNVFSGNYIITNNISLGIRARHYWSRVDYSSFFELTEQGELRGSNYEDPENANNINFSTFNIDLLFNWEFAPGSALSVSYKNSAFDYTNEIEGNIFRNLGQLFDDVQTNTISLSLIYYLDYNTVRSWGGKRKAA